MKKWRLFSDTPFNFFRKIKWWTFWETLPFQSHSTTNLLLLPIFKVFNFFQKIHHFSRKKWTFREIAIFYSHSTTILLSLAILENSCFFWKNFSSFRIKINFWTFWEFLLFLSHFTANLLNSAHFINWKTIFPKTHLCFDEPQNLNVSRSVTDWVDFYRLFLFNKIKFWKFWKFHYFSLNPRQICYFYP